MASVYLKTLFLFLACCAGFTSSYASSPFILKDSHAGEPLGRHLLLYKDDSNSQNVLQVWSNLAEFKASQDDYPNWKITEATTWAFFQIENPVAKEQTLYLENYYAMTDSISLYFLGVDHPPRMINLGDHQAFDDRPVFYRNPVFPVQVKPGINDFLISIQTSGPNRMPFRVWTDKELHLKMTIENFLLGGGFGFVAFMVVYNFFISVSLRSKTYFFYVAYGLSFLLLQIGMQGVTGYMFESFSVQKWVGNWGFLAGAQASQLFASLFSMHFLDLKRKLPQVYRLFVGLCWLYSGLLAAVLLQFDYHSLARIINVVTVVSTISMLALGFYFTYKQHRPAYFYTGAWIFLLLGGLSFSLSNLGIAPVNFVTTYGSFIGGCCEMSLLSFALADRVRYLREMRIKEKEAYIQDLMQKDQETQHSYIQLAKIVYPHQISLMKKGSNLEETMLTGHSKAVVIVFDIIASTKFDGANKQDFFQKVFLNCYQRMMKQYDEENFMAEAYRIKELGDGFMCSVGFPFPIDSKQQRNVIAFELVMDFIEIFDRIHSEFYENKPCYCSIGIAEGDVVGFYPVAGVREYDLNGEAIIRANRYENIRRILFPEVKSHIMIAQAGFVEQLPAAVQKRFHCHSINEWKDFQIRDDSEARAFYALFLDQKTLLTQYGQSA